MCDSNMDFDEHGRRIKSRRVTRQNESTNNTADIVADFPSRYQNISDDTRHVIRDMVQKDRHDELDNALDRLDRLFKP